MRAVPRYSATVAVSCLLAALGCGPDQPSPTAPDDGPAVAVSATAAALSFFQLSAGWMRTCGVTTDNHAYCWGDNAQGYLGDGTRTDRLSPRAVVGGLLFRQITTGADFTCGVTTDFRAYCWGYGGRGVLGNGQTAEHDSPVAVVGGHQFRQLDAGFDHVCGVSYPDNRVYCWGGNRDGQLGIGTRTGPETCIADVGNLGACSTKPVPIASTLTFRQVATGWYHSCAVTTDDRLFCWGLNSSGQVGDSTTAFRQAKPSRVGRSQHWKQVDGGNDFTCAVTTAEQAFCWGNGGVGQIGNGHTYLSFWPRPVSGSHAFRRVTAGAVTACGETPSNVAWCWGGYFVLSNGTTVGSLTPAAVPGGLFFSQVSAGYGQICGRTPAAVGYCWGNNTNGELGIGQADFASHPNPTPIGPPS
jgi:alpha-tubulin suppressor-like RCC1 family protein